jgi:hypothetical protein
MHIGSVLSGLEAENVNNDKRSRFWVVSICTKRSKMWIFSNFGGLAGDFYKDTYEAKLFGMHGGRFSVMWTSHGSQPFRR